MNKNIKSFVEHNYITLSEKDVKVQLYFLTVVIQIGLLICLFFGTEGNINGVDIVAIIYIFAILPIAIFAVYRTDRSASNKRFLMLQIVYLIVGCINLNTAIVYLVYKGINGRSALICIMYTLSLVAITFYISFRKQEKWIKTGAYAVYSYELANWDMIHAKIWHKDSYIHVIVFGGALLLGRVTQSVAVIAFVALSIQVFIVIDLVKYYMQLKYAKKYGMLDLLPSAPNEELTP